MAVRAVIVGAGHSGLATALFLRRELGPDAEIAVLDADKTPGGKVRTATVAGLPVDTGPDAFLSRGADLREVIDAVGLTSSVVEPMPGGAFIWSRGRLRPIPPGASFGLPERLWPVLRSGLLSPAGTLRASVDLVRPRTTLPPDPSIGDLVRPRFGREVYERMVEPLLGGIHAGSPDALSASSTVPEIAALARSGRSMTLTMRKRRRTPTAHAAPTAGERPPAPLVSIEGGMGRLTAAMVEAIGADAIRTGSPVTSIARNDDAWTVIVDGDAIEADAVVLATPAFVTARLVEPLSPTAASALRAIPYVDVANATLAFRRTDLVADLGTTPRGTGFLVPPVEGRFVVGCSWLTSKWPHLANDDIVLMKAMVGRWGDTRWLDMGDDAIVDGVRADLRDMLGITATPIDTLVQRWPQAMPQYVVGHAERLAVIDDALAALDGLVLAGAAYRGSGLAACTTAARAAAARIADTLTNRQDVA